MQWQCAAFADAALGQQIGYMGAALNEKLSSVNLVLG